MKQPAQQAFPREFVEKVGTRAKKKERTGEGEGNEVACVASVSARVRRESWDESEKKKKE